MKILELSSSQLPTGKPLGGDYGSLHLVFVCGWYDEQLKGLFAISMFVDLLRQMN